MIKLEVDSVNDLKDLEMSALFITELEAPLSVQVMCKENNTLYNYETEQVGDKYLLVTK